MPQMHTHFKRRSLERLFFVFARLFAFGKYARARALSAIRALNPHPHTSDASGVHNRYQRLC